MLFFSYAAAMLSCAGRLIWFVRERIRIMQIFSLVINVGSISAVLSGPVRGGAPMVLPYKNDGVLVVPFKLF